MSAHVTGYAYPWDVRRGFADRVAAPSWPAAAWLVLTHNSLLGGRFPECARSWEGLDPERVRVVLCAEVRGIIATGELTTTTDELPDDLRENLLAGRWEATDRLRRAVLGPWGRAVGCCCTAAPT